MTSATVEIGEIGAAQDLELDGGSQNSMTPAEAAIPAPVPGRHPLVGFMIAAVEIGAKKRWRYNQGYPNTREPAQTRLESIHNTQSFCQIRVLREDPRKFRFQKRIHGSVVPVPLCLDYMQRFRLTDFYVGLLCATIWDDRIV